ncbi:hypothetical protein MMC18_005375, partial [Xylographa bjoerkii]|nr:hypothetical protein [Xylographa bjoerkii]
MAAENPDYPWNRPTAEVKQYNRRIRRATLTEDQHSERRRSQTVAECVAAMDILTEGNVSVVEMRLRQCDDDFEELEDKAPQEEDSETRYLQSKSIIEKSTDAKHLEELVEGDSPEQYHLSAMSFMSMILENTLSQRQIGKAEE